MYSAFGSGSQCSVDREKIRSVVRMCPPEGVDQCPPSAKTKYASDGSVITTQLWKPLAVLALQIAFITRISKEGVYTHSFAIPLAATALYCAFIMIGKKVMSKRPPFLIKGWLFSYNLYQVVLNAYVALSLCLEAYRSGFSVWGNTYDDGGVENGSKISFLLLLHYQNKYVELADTVFMILRKKESQVTTLHVYHHLLLLWSWYFVMNIAPGGDAYFGALVNSVTHVPLYTYYGLCLLGYACPWKIILTALQISQFIVCATHAAYCMYVGNYPHSLLILDMFVQCNMLLLFGHFCCTTYRHVKMPTVSERAKDDKRENRNNRQKKERSISLAEVRRHRTAEDCWCAVHGAVLDITDFVSKHPGGDVIVLAAGREATILAETYHPNGIPKSVMERYRIGNLPQSEANASYYSWESPFYKTLRRRVVAKLRSLGRSRRGGVEIWTKSVALVLAFIACNYFVCVAEFGIPAVAAAVALGFVSAKIGTNVQHDGSHGAFARSRWLNTLSAWTLDMIGASAQTWAVQHVLGHHPYTNLLTIDEGTHAHATNRGGVANNVGTKQEESDPDVFGSYPLMRMHPTQPKKWFHAYQHLYGPFVFALMTLAKSYQQDLDVIRDWRLLHIDATCLYASASKRWRFWIMKALSVGYMILLPMYCQGPIRGLFLFFVAHLTAGETLATFFIVNHVIEGVAYASNDSTDEQARPITNGGKCPMSLLKGSGERREESVPLNDWAAVQCQTSVNWSSGSWFWNHVSGGLNHQIEHHLFPSICHTNYVHIHPIVQKTCAEFGVPYQTEESLWTAYKKMILHLKSLGNEKSGDVWERKQRQ
eukprot:g138.t1